MVVFFAMSKSMLRLQFANSQSLTMIPAVKYLSPSDFPLAALIMRASLYFASDADMSKEQSSKVTLLIRENPLDVEPKIT